MYFALFNCKIIRFDCYIYKRLYGLKFSCIRISVLLELLDLHRNKNTLTFKFGFSSLEHILGYHVK